MADHLVTKHAGFQEPSPWIVRWADLAPVGAPVLDLACGGGRHGRLFLERGHAVTFLDRDISAVSDLEDRADATCMQVDLETGAPFPLTGQQFGAVIVTCYLHRPILPAILEAVAPRGILLYETFARGNEAYGHPAREAYLLEEGELLNAVQGTFTVRAYEHGYNDEPKPGIRQRICAIRHL
jgi:SAM-dependent methyltransferase